MSLKSEIQHYIDGDGLVAPAIVPAGTKRASDNGPLFTSVYYIMLKRNGELNLDDLHEYMLLMNLCVGADGNLHRAPGDTSNDEYDDHIAVLAGYAEFYLRVPFSLPFRLWRFPQLVYAYLLNKGVPAILMLPLGLVNSAIIALSSIGDPASDSNSRQLTWLQIQATQKKSLLAHMSGDFWHWRQTKVWGTPKVMQAVAQVYYQLGHPFGRYWVD